MKKKQEIQSSDNPKNMFGKENINIIDSRCLL